MKKSEKKVLTIIARSLKQRCHMHTSKPKKRVGIFIISINLYVWGILTHCDNI